MKIALKDIKPNGKAIRTAADKEKMQELVASIRDRGIIVPPKIRRHGDSYEIVYGHRRISAAKQADLKEIECIVEGTPDEEVVIQALIENVVREDMNDADKRDALRTIKEQTGKTWAQVGAMFGWSEDRVKRLANITDEEAAVIRRGGVDATLEHVRASHAAGDMAMPVLKKAANEGLSQRQTERVAKSVAAAKTPERKRQLLETLYSTQLHDPELVRKAPTIKSFKQERRERQELTPAVADAIRDIEGWYANVETLLDMHAAGKFSPEGSRFVAAKLRKFAAAVISAANKMG